MAHKVLHLRSYKRSIECTKLVMLRLYWSKKGWEPLEMVIGARAEPTTITEGGSSDVSQFLSSRKLKRIQTSRNESFT